MSEQPAAVGPVHLDVPEWDTARPISTCRRLLEAARTQGITPDVCLDGTGLSTADIHGGVGEVHAAQELALVRNILGVVADPHALARAAGSRYTLADMGVLGYAILASPTMGQAVDTACRYAVLSSTSLRLTRRDEAGGAAISFANDHLPADVRPFVLERDMYALINMAPLLVGQLAADAVVRVELPGIQVPLQRLRRLRIEIEIDTAAARAKMYIPRALLGRPMPAADAVTAAECIRQCDELMAARRWRRGLAGPVRERLRREPGNLPSMAVLAAELCVSERTLHRRLADENTSYRTLVDEVRAKLASTLLSSDFAVHDAAQRLGYTEVAAFTRAFSRWTGETPSAFRRRARGQRHR